MSSSITAADSALDQLEALLQLVAVNVHQLPPPSDGAKSHFDQVRQLSVDEAWTSLRQLQLWLASFPTDASAHIVRCLCIFLKAFQGHTVPPDLKDVRRTTVQAVRTESPTHALEFRRGADLQGRRGPNASWADAQGGSRRRCRGGRRRRRLWMVGQGA